MRSLKKQVILSILAVETLCGAAFAGSTLTHEWRVRVHSLDTAIRGRSDSLLGAVQDAEDPGDNVIVDPTELEIPSDDVYAVYNQEGRLLGASHKAPAALVTLRKAGMSTHVAAGISYRVLQRDGLRVIDRAENAGVGLRRPVTIIYAVPNGRIWRDVREGVGFYLGVGAALIVITAVSMIILLRRVLQPLQELATEAGAISFRSLQFVSPPSALKLRELQPLAETLTVMVNSLQRAFEQQARFVGDAAHELKTAVSVVRSSAELLLLRPRDCTEYISGLKAVLFDNARVEELVARMLILARFEEQALNTKPNFLSVSDVSVSMRRVLERLEAFREAQEVKIRLILAANLKVQLPSDELEEIISNLAVNAIQHSRKGTEVIVSVVERPGFAILNFEDTGDGILPEALPHVFERFYREDRSRARDTGGVGLGLAICKSIVDAAAGDISIESTKDVGTLVTVQLPLAQLSSGSLNL